jgi:hypothetical protein
MDNGRKVKLALYLTNCTLGHEDIWGSSGAAPSFLTSALHGGEWSALTPWPLYTPPQKELPVPIGQEAGWTPELVWTMWKEIHNFVSYF